MKFVGDEEGIAALKRMKEERLEYLKYLLTEARTNVDRTTTFKDNDQKYRITYNPQTQELTVAKEGASPEE